MASFNTALDLLAEYIKNNTALQNFALAKWQKRFTVIRKFKPRTQINATEIPLIMVTRPSVKKSYKTGARDGTHTVRLYVLFRQDNTDKAQAEIVEVEEKIDDCLLAPEPGTLGLRKIDPDKSDNDEGLFHPNYSIVMDTLIDHRRA